MSASGEHAGESPQQVRYPFESAYDRPDSRSSGIVQPTASYRVFSWTAFVHANITCVCHLSTVLLVFLKLDGPLQQAPWPALLAPEFFYHVVVRGVCQLAWMHEADAWVQAQLGPPPRDDASSFMHMRYADKRARRLRTHRIECVLALMDGAAMLTVKAVVCWILATGRWSSLGVSWGVVGLPLWVVWPVGLLLTLRKPTRSWKLVGLRDLLYVFLAMLASKLDGATLTWDAVCLVPYVALSALLLMAFVWSGYLLAIACHPTYRVKMPQLAWGVSACFLAPVAHLPAFALAARRLEGDTSVSLQSIFIPSLVSWAACVVAGNNLAVALGRQERDRARRAADGLAWVHHPGASDQRAEQAAHERRVFALPEEELVTLVRQMLSGGGVKPQYLLKVGDSMWRPVADKAAAPDACAPPAPPPRHTKRLGGGDDAKPVGGGDGGGCGALSVVVVATEDDVSRGGGDGDARPPAAIAEPFPRRPSAAAGAGDGAPPAADEASPPPECGICFSGDAPPAYVFLDCGHGGYCRRCAYLVAARHPRQCPHCRAPIRMVVRVEDAHAPVGRLARVVCEE